jgi:DNA-binding beta-propeller fold protein YncE/ABC-type branched-subunit amino acid transport system substrate-binding protein
MSVRYQQNSHKNMQSKYLIITVEESDSSVGMYDPQTGRQVAKISTGFWPHEIAVSEDGKTAYVTNFGIKDYDEHIGTPGASISVIDIPKRCEARRLYTFGSVEEYHKFKAPHGIKLSPDGSKLYVNVEGEDEEMLVFDLQSDLPVAQKALPLHLPKPPAGKEQLTNAAHFNIPEGTHNFIFSPDGAHIFLGSGKAGLFKISAQDGTVQQHILADSLNPVRGVAYSVDKSTLIVSGYNKITLVNPATFEIIQSFGNLEVTQILYAQPSPDGKYIIAPAVWESVVLVIDLNTGQVIKRIPVGIDPIHIAFSPGGGKAYVSHGRSKFIAEIDLVSLSVSNKIATNGGPNGLAVVPCLSIPVKAVLRLGACLPLSGLTAAEGREIRLGYQFWQERVNASGGILVGGQAYLVELVFRDTFSRSLGPADKNFIQQLVHELIFDEKIDFLLGSYPTPPNLYIAELAHKYRIPMITATGAGEIIYNQGYDFVYGIMSPARVYLAGTIEVLLTEHANNKPRSAIFLSCNDPAALEDARKTAAFAASKGLQLLNIPETPGCTFIEDGVYAYAHNQQDFTGIVKAIKHAAPDLFFNTGHLSESEFLLPAIADNNFAPKAIAFSVGPAIPSFRRRFGKRSLYLFGSAQWNESVIIAGHDDMETPGNFARCFFDRFSMPASYFSAGGYACGIVLRNALTAAGSTDKELVNHQLKATDTTTFFAHIAFDHRGLNDSKPIITVQIQETGAQKSITEAPVYPKHLANHPTIYPFPGWKSSQ